MPMTWLLLGLGALLVLITIVGVLPIAHGLSRMAEVPRQQLAIAATLYGAMAFVALDGVDGLFALSMALVVLCVQVGWILRFTPVWPQQAVAVENVDRETSVRFLVLNVKLSNRDYQRTIDLVRSYDPDVMVLVEVDDAWVNALATELGAWSHQLLEPLDTGYGLALYSRLHVRESSVRNLVLDGVPSLWAVVELRDGMPFRLVAAHPEPPVPYADSVGRDAELGRVAEEVAQDSIPCIVTGDLNDVGWSRTTRRFQRMSGLVDPRVGRGLFNTFHTATRLARWPLDHLFHDPGFGLVSMGRLPDVGSDHFPMGFHLQWTGDNEARIPEPAREEDVVMVEELVQIEAERDRAPVGEDWEGE